MKFLIDAQLPPLLKECFIGHDVIHALDLADGTITKDSKLNEISILERRVLITKDTDFYHSYISSRKPWKLVLVKTGNIRLGILMGLFRRNSKLLIEKLQIHSFIILEPDRIRVLD